MLYLEEEEPAHVKGSVRDDGKRVSGAEAVLLQPGQEAGVDDRERIRTINSGLCDTYETS